MSNPQVTESPLWVWRQGAFTSLLHSKSSALVWCAQSGRVDAPEEGGEEPWKNELKTFLKHPKCLTAWSKSKSHGSFKVLDSFPLEHSWTVLQMVPAEPEGDWLSGFTESLPRMPLSPPLRSSFRSWMENKAESEVCWSCHVSQCPSK